MNLGFEADSFGLGSRRVSSKVGPVSKQDGVVDNVRFSVVYARDRVLGMTTQVE